jgi:FMN phosphatase YigB (HAD superfamily)
VDQRVGPALDVAITAVLFDLDDTLFDHRACTRDALGDLRRRFPALGTVPADLFEAEHGRLLEHLHLDVLAGRLSVDDARVAIGVVTNNVAAEQRQKITACGFGPLLDAVLISEEAGVTKPDPRIFRMALAQLGSPAEEAVMLGDAWDTDIAGARAAGIRPIWFNRFGAQSPDPSVTEIHSLTPGARVLSLLFSSP